MPKIGLRHLISRISDHGSYIPRFLQRKRLSVLVKVEE